jgi:hypothetical protein
VVLEGGGGIRNDKEVTSGIGKSIFPTPPPPPSIKVRMARGGGVGKHYMSLI